jgi:glycosyltransferase involved in cell wall biosynthesis
MKIAVLSRSDASGGGAGRVADELSAGLRTAGHRVLRLYRKGQPAADRDTLVLHALRGEQALRQTLGVDLSSAPLLLVLARHGIEMVHFHDHHMAFGLRTAQAIAGRLPTCFTFHDYTGFTGGCLYPGACSRYDRGCGSCPETGRGAQPARLDRSAATWDANRRFGATAGVVGISPSSHFAELAARGAWFGREIEVIPNGVDTATFSPSVRAASRVAEGVGASERVLLFVAVQLGDPRKGLIDLCKALAPRFAQDPTLTLWLVGGEDQLPPDLALLGGRARRFGRIGSKARLAELYAAADLFLLPSHEDNLPCTAVEALSCGTPVIGRPVGGIGEIFEHGRSGLLARDRTVEALGWAIDQGLTQLTGQDGRRAARRFAEQRFGMETFVARHEAAYDRAVTAWAGKAER